MATSKIEQIRSVLKDKIRNYNKVVSHDVTGEVITVGDGIALVRGLKMTFMNEVLEFENGVKGLAISLDEDLIGLTILGDSNSITSGMKIKRTNKTLEVPVGEQMLGRIVNALGEAIDGEGDIVSKKFLPVERPAKGIMDRESVNEPMQTGILAIDSIIPIGKGQRELIIGDRQTGKTAVAIDTIINQKGKNVRCVYVTIGQKNSTTTYTVEKLRDHGAMDYTTIVVANSSDEAAMQYIAPYAGVTIAEEWMEQGKDVLIIYDDLTKHAAAYRTLSLLLRRPPGREAYPGDVFYLHSRLLERAAKLNKSLGNGSITALPIIETQAGDISAYIPTNVISITDGQIFLMTDAFNSGQRPAVDSGLSVSRVGSNAQIKAMKQASSSLKLELAQFGELESFSQFGSDLDKVTQGILNHGRRIKEILKQKQYSPYNQIDQAIILYAVKKHIIDSIAIERMADFKTSLIDFFKTNKYAKEIRDAIESSKEIGKDVEPKLVNALEEFAKIFSSYSARTNLGNFQINQKAKPSKGKDVKNGKAKPDAKTSAKVAPKKVVAPKKPISTAKPKTTKPSAK